MLLLLLTLVTSLQSPSDPQARVRLVPEGNPKSSFKDGVLELRGGAGWLRLQNPVLDFDASFEMRALTPEVDLGLVVRTWRGWGLWPERGYRLSLPLADVADVSRLLVGKKQKVNVLKQGSLQLQPSGEWQRVRVVGRGPGVVVSINGALAAEFEVETYGGYLMFDNRKGRVELRGLNIVTSAVNEAIPDGLMRQEPLKAAGGVFARVLHQVRPEYTPEAMRAMVQGVVRLEAVVSTDGSVGPVRVTGSLHPDLDVSAVAALKAWRFQPATLNGGAVAVLAEVEMSFALQ
jgi:TonB family protein